ncbi:MAG: Fe(2+) transporter permease subunit FeoB [Zoogloeaceae bacterium]|jgi:ferrous iron transport protein B|nr:Fe(2+) transporter permease subunit FeoB [Zoogloeaceae bacterium]
MREKSPLTIALLGNPNCGKTTLFNALTGARQKVGNWPGVTVEKKSGRFTQDGRDIDVVDLPGIYSLDIAGEGSLDERVAREFALSGEADLIVNILDASNLERNLYLTAQLLEMRVPMLVALNMCDVADERGVAVDADALSQALGCPVVALVAKEKQGVEALKTLLATTERFVVPTARPGFPDRLATAIDAARTLTDALLPEHMDADWAAQKALEGDAGVLACFSELDASGRDFLARTRQSVEAALGDDLDVIAADARYAFIADLVARTMRRGAAKRARSLSDRVDQVVLNRALGIPIFFFMMYLMFLFTIHLGGAFIDFFDGLAELVFVKGLGYWLSAMGSPEWLKVLLADGIGGGLQTVASFIPIIGFLFLFLSLLEDSGYMARAAFVMDRFMRFVGLPGKSFVPLIVGFGCNVPSVMAARTLEGERDRLMTIAMSPFMSCGARLTVYVLFAAAFFPQGGQNLVFLLYLVGIAVAVLTGMALRHTLLQGQSTPFILELPPYHMPTIKGVILHSWHRLSAFIFKAGKIIVPMVMVLNILNAMGTDGSFGHEDSEDSMLSSISRRIAPAFSPIGVTEENWPAAVGIFTGILAKEAVVGTLDALYGQVAASEEKAARDAEGEESETEEEAAPDFLASMKEVAATIPENLSALSEKLLDPLGLSVGEIEDKDASAEAQGVSVDTFSAMQRMFGGTAAAFSYLVLILLYFPCVAVLGAVRQEVGVRWALFVSFWSIALGYGAATLCYQFLTFAEHPLNSVLWGAGILAFLALTLLCMRWYGQRQWNAMPRLAEESV